MKKIITKITSIIIFFATLESVVFARAGGGGGGFSGGGGGGRLFHRHLYRHVYDASGNQGLAGFAAAVCLLFEIGVLGVAVVSTVLFVIKLKRSKRNSKLLLSKLEKEDPIWNAKALDNHVRNSFYKIQKAWSDDKIHLVKHLLSDTLYADFQKKLELNRKDNVQNVLSKIQLLDAYPMSVQDRIGEENDCVWYYIEAKMLDLTIDLSTRRVLSDIRTPQKFVEYWRFCKKDKSWVLDRISQQQEFESLIGNSQRPQ